MNIAASLAFHLRRQLRHSVPAALLARISDEEIIEQFYLHNDVRDRLAYDREERRRKQAGYLLLELLVCLMLLMTLMSLSVPSFVQMHYNDQAASAKAQVILVRNVRAAVIVCESTQGCAVDPGLAALSPSPGTLDTGGYHYVSTPTTYSAVPLNPNSNQQTFSVDVTGTVLCGGSPCR